MTQKDYVTPEVAELLKEKGYKHFTSQTLCGEFKDATLWDVQKWLREEHHIAVCPTPYDFTWFFVNYNLNETYKDDFEHEIIGNNTNYKSYTQALNEGIKEALKWI